MDLQTMLISVGITLVSAVVIYLIYACGMQERTYEEVIAEQRRLHQSELLTSKKTDKKEKVKKKKKAKADKVASSSESEKVEEVVEEEVEEVAEVVPELEPMIEQPPVAVTPSKGSKKRKDKRVPRDDAQQTSVMSVQEATVTKEVHREVHREVRQRTEVHLEKTTEHKVTSSAGKHKDDVSKASRSLEAELALEALIQNEAKANQRSERESKKSKKNKGTPEPAGGGGKVAALEEQIIPTPAVITGGRGGNPYYAAELRSLDAPKASNSQLIQTVRNTTLNDNEIQSMIEVLLNKQGASAPSVEWTKKSQKGDPLSLIKKQLEDKDRALNEEQQFSMTANNKLKELKQELHGERQRYAALEKSSQEKVSSQMAEITALHARMQSSHAQHANEIKVLRQQMDNMKGALADSGHNARMHQLTEENRKLKEAAAKAGDMTSMNQQMKLLQEQLNIAMSKAANLDRAKNSSEKRMEDQIRKLEASKRDSESVLSRKLTEVNDELRRAEAHNANMSRDLEKSSTTTHHMEQELANLRNHMKSLESDTTQQETIQGLEKRLQDAEKSRAELEETVRATEQKLHNIQKQNTDKETRLNEMSKENSMLVAQLQSTKERTAGEGQEAPSNEPSNTAQAASKETASVQFEKTLREKDQTVNQLQSELQGKLDEIKKLSQELDTQKNKNNALREKNWKVMDALKKAENMAEGAANLRADLSSRDSQIKQLTSQLETAKKHPHALEQEQNVTKEEMVKLTHAFDTSASRPSEELQQLKSTLQATQAESKEKVEQLEALLQTSQNKSKQEVEQLRQDLEEAGVQAREIQQLKLDLEAAKAAATEAAQLHVQVKELQTQAAEVSQLKEELAAAKSATVDGAAAGREESEALRNQLNAAQKDVADRQQELESSKQSLEEQAARFKQELSAATGQVDTLQQELQKAQQAQQEHQEKQSQLQAALETNKEVEALRIQVESAAESKNELESLRSQLQSAKEDKMELDSLRSKLQSVEESKEQLACGRDQLQGELDSLRQQLTAGEDAKNEAIKKEQERMQSELAASHSKLQDLEKEHQALQASTIPLADHELLKTQLDTANQSAAELTTLREELRVTKLAAEKTVQLEKDLSERSSPEEFSNVQAELQVAKDTAQRLTTELEDLRNQGADIQAKDAEVKKLQTELEQLRQQAAENQSKDDEVKRLQAELEQLQQQAAVNQSKDDEVKRLQAELEAVKTVENVAPEQQNGVDHDSELQELQLQLTAAQAKQTEMAEQLTAKEQELVVATEKHRTQLEQLQQSTMVSEQKDSAKVQQDMKRLKEELATMKKENHELRVGCETATKALTKAEKAAEEIAQVQAELKAKAAEVTSLQDALDGKQAELDAMSSQLANGQQNSGPVQDSEQVSTTTSSHHHTESHSTKVNQMTVLTRTRVEERSTFDITRILADLDARDAELAVLREVLSQKEHQLQMLQDSGSAASSESGEMAHLRQQVAYLTHQHQEEACESASQISRLQQQLHDEKARNDELRMQVKSGGRVGSFLTRSSATAELQEQLDIKVSEIEKLRDIVKDYWNKNNELTEKVDHLEAESEQSRSKMAVQLRQQVKELTKELEAAKADHLQKAPAAAMKPSTPSGELLKRLFPEAKIKSDMTEDEWASTFESEAKKYMEKVSISNKNSGSNDEQLKAAQQAQAKLQAQVQHYKAVLADTEGILNKLQSSVESEEKKWQQRTVDEVNRIKEELNKNSSGPEVQEQIRLLEEKLSVTESERESLKSQLSQSSQSLSSLQSQLEASSQQSLAEEELSTLKELLAEERKSKKELSSANVRLNSLVKIGQDALKAEQDVVKKLQTQVAAKQQSLANGTSSSSPQIKELKDKLAKTQRQLDRETQNNRQLSKRVAASAANNGTSV